MARDSDPRCKVMLVHESDAELDHHFFSLDEMVEAFCLEGVEPGGFPSFWKDPFGKRDFTTSALKHSLPRVLVGLAIYCVGLYLNNLSQAWLQANISNYYEAGWAPIPPFNVTPPFPNVSSSTSEWNNASITWEWPAVRRPIPESPAHKNEMVTLWDVTFAYLPFVHTSTPADMFAGLSCLIALVRFAVLPGPFSMRWTFLSRAFVIWGLLFACRSITISVTPLPNPYHSCVPRITFPDNIWLEAVFLFPGVGNELTCQDVMFSGHTVMGTLFTLFLMRYKTLAPWSRLSTDERCCTLPVFFDVLAAFWLLGGYFFITASHFHYTVDVLVGVMMTVLCFNSYHYVVKIIWLRKQHPARASFTPFLRWFESDAPDLKIWRLRAQRNLTVLQLDLRDEGTEDTDSDANSA